jgi:hypothetical protein
MVEVVLLTDDGIVDPDFEVALQSAIEDGRLDETIKTQQSDSTIMFYLNSDEPPPAIVQNSTSFSPSGTPTRLRLPTISPAPTSSCFDTIEFCEDWASRSPSECEVNAAYMELTCPKSCGVCDEMSMNNETMNPSIEYNETVSPDGNETDIFDDDNLDKVTDSPTSFNDTDNDFNSTDPDDDEIDGNMTTAPTEAIPCEDQNDKCGFWAKSGECDNNPDFMLENCQVACGLCVGEPVPCENQDDRCESWAEVGECENNPEFMLVKCSLACGNCDGQPSDSCVDARDECPGWSEDGECENNPAFMLENCRQSCGACNEEEPFEDCSDARTECVAWALIEECDNNPGFMVENCPKSCGLCISSNSTALPGGNSTDSEGAPVISASEEICEDVDNDCEKYASTGECKANPTWMNENCARSCGVCEIDIR